LQQALIEGVGEAVQNDFKRFDWDSAFRLQRKYGWGELTSNLLLVGQKDQTTPIHYDEQDNLFCQLTGHKRVIMASPDQYSTLYPFPLHHSSDRQSQINIFEPVDADKFPKFSKLQALQGTVGPGDVLFIPPYWWHHISSLDETVSVTFWFKCAPQAGAPQLPLRPIQMQALRRNIERMLGETITPALMKPFFEWIEADNAEPNEDFSEALKSIRKLLEMVMPAEEVDGWFSELGAGRFSNLAL